jgi:DNA-binding transcriptional MerR regulator
MKTLAIGKVAAASGLSGDAIRYYQRRGILPRSVPSYPGCRGYDQAALDMLLVIRRGRDAGLSLPALLVQLRNIAPGPGRKRT